MRHALPESDENLQGLVITINSQDGMRDHEAKVTPVIGTMDLYRIESWDTKILLLYRQSLE